MAVLLVAPGLTGQTNELRTLRMQYEVFAGTSHEFSAEIAAHRTIEESTTWRRIELAGYEMESGCRVWSVGSSRLTAILFDWWRFDGKVLEAAGRNAAVPQAKVLLKMYGAEFRPVADTSGLDRVCMGSVLLVTGEHGDFSVDRRVDHHFLVNKRVEVLIFKPGFSVHLSEVTMSSWLTSRRIRVALQKAEGVRAAANSDRAVSNEITSLALAISEGNDCGPASWEFLLELFEYAKTLPVTQAERDVVKGRCRILRRIASRTDERQFTEDCDALF